MAAVRSLCTRGVVLQNGMQVFDGSQNDAIDYYLHSGHTIASGKIKDNIEWIKPGLSITDIFINGTDEANSVIKSEQESLPVCITGHSSFPLESEISMVFRNEDEMPCASFPFCDASGKLFSLNGDFKIEANIRLPKTLYKGLLKIDIFFHQPNVEFQLKATSCCLLECEGFLYKFGQTISQKRSGLLQFESI